MIAIYQEHFNDYVTFIISSTNLIISLALGLLWTLLAYVINNMEDYNVLLIDLSLIVNAISFSYPFPVSHMSLLNCCTSFYCFALYPKIHGLDYMYIATREAYNIGQFHLPPPLHYRDYYKQKQMLPKRPLFSNNYIYIDLISIS